MVYTVYMTTAPTVQRIATAARRLLDKEGADAVTMRRVASAVGITPMAVYRHYPNRAGLLNALADAGFDELAARLAEVRSVGDLEKRLTNILNIYLEHALQNPRLFELMFTDAARRRSPLSAGLQGRPFSTANPMAELIREGMATGYFRKDDAWEIIFEMGALLQGLVMLYLGGRMAVSPARFRAFCHRSFRRYLHGIRN